MAAADPVRSGGPSGDVFTDVFFGRALGRMQSVAASLKRHIVAVAWVLVACTLAVVYFAMWSGSGPEASGAAPAGPDERRAEHKIRGGGGIDPRDSRARAISAALEEARISSEVASARGPLGRAARAVGYIFLMPD